MGIFINTLILMFPMTALTAAWNDEHEMAVIFSFGAIVGTIALLITIEELDNKIEYYESIVSQEQKYEVFHAKQDYERLLKPEAE